MSEIEPMVRFEHKATWTIKNFDFRSEKPITSQKFDLMCFDVTSWSLCLHPQGDTQTNYMQFSIRLHYARSHNVPELFLNSVKFVIYIVDDDNMMNFCTEGFYVPSYSKPESPAVKFIRRKDFHVSKHLDQSGALVLRCELTTTGRLREYLSTVYSPELVSLSSSVYGMLQHPTHSDIMALSENQRGVDVHLCILRNRCPILLEGMGEVKAGTQDKTEAELFWLSHMSTRALKLLLAYLYGRVYIEVPNEERSELKSVASKYNLHHLERQLVEYPLHVGLGTEFVVEDATFKFEVRKIEWDGDDVLLNLMTYTPKLIPNASELILTFKLARKGHYENYIQPSFKFKYPIIGVPIHLHCRFYLLDNKGGVLLKSRGYSHTFTDEEWGPPPTPPFATKGFCITKKAEILKCVVRISEMSHRNLDSSEVSESKPRTIIPVFNNLRVLSEDMKKMYHARSNCDLKIVVLEEEFFGHRSFLKRRSGLISEKLEALEKHLLKKGNPAMLTIELEGISPYIFGKVIEYMYSGKINIENQEMAIAVDSTANYLRLPLLFAKLIVVTSA